MEEIVLYYDIFGIAVTGHLGIQPFSIAAYFGYLGIPYISYPGIAPKNIDETIGSSSVTIIGFYWYNSGSFGGHYVSVKPSGSKFIMHNESNGSTATSSFTSIQAWLEDTNTDTNWNKHFYSIFL